MNTDGDERYVLDELNALLQSTPTPESKSDNPLQGLDWVDLVTWLNLMIDSHNRKIADYKAMKKRTDLANLDGQIRYWSNQVSTFKWISKLVSRANGC